MQKEKSNIIWKLDNTFANVVEICKEIFDKNKLVKVGNVCQLHRWWGQIINNSITLFDKWNIAEKLFDFRYKTQFANLATFVLRT